MTICVPSASSVALYYNLSKFNQNLSKNKLPGLLPQGREGFPVFPQNFTKKRGFHPKNAIYGAKIVMLSILSLVYPNLIQIYSVLHGGTHSKSLDIIYNWFKSCGM